MKANKLWTLYRFLERLRSYSTIKVAAIDQFLATERRFWETMPEEEFRLRAAIFTLGRLRDWLFHFNLSGRTARARGPFEV